MDLVLPRFVQEGKKYATIAIGCTGGRHRSVWLIQRLAAHLSSRLAAMHAAGESELDWRQTVTHRELKALDALGGGHGQASPTAEKPNSDVRVDGDGENPAPVQAQEA